MAIKFPLGIKDQAVLGALRDIINEINRETDEIEFTVAVAGTEVTVPHGLNRTPTSAAPVVTEATTGQGVIYPGTTAWDATNVYLTATATGVYHVRVRR